MAKPVPPHPTDYTTAGTTNSLTAQTGGDIVIQRVTYSLAGQTIAMRVTGDPVAANNGLFYLHSNHLGSTSAMSSSSGQLVGEVNRYTPFGDYRSGGPNAITDRGFTGQKENMELGLYYYNARFYVPGIGRFASADTIVPNPANPQSFNRYSYVLNNPLNLIDPSGHRPSDGCDYEGCLTDSDYWESNLTNYNKFPVLGEKNERQKLQEQRDGWLRQSCISQGAGCSSDMKFRFFGIPSTREQNNALIAREAYELCAGGGACGRKQVGIMLSTIMLPFAPALKWGASIPTLFEGGDAIMSGDWESAGQEIMFDAGGEITDSILPTNVPIGGFGWGAVDIAMDIKGLPDLAQGYLQEAEEKVALQVTQAETAFMNAHLASHGIFPWNRPRPSIYE